MDVNTCLLVSLCPPSEVPLRWCWTEGCAGIFIPEPCCRFTVSGCPTKKRADITLSFLSSKPRGPSHLFPRCHTKHLALQGDVSPVCRCMPTFHCVFFSYTLLRENLGGLLSVSLASEATANTPLPLPLTSYRKCLLGFSNFVLLLYSSSEIILPCLSKVGEVVVAERYLAVHGRLLLGPAASSARLSPYGSTVRLQIIQ